MTSGTELGAAGEPTHATGATRTRTQPETIVDTAEIQPVAPSRPRRVSSPYEHAYEEPVHRAPAPWGLQVAVWLLFFVFVVGLVGLAVEHFQPRWISFLRNTLVAHPSGSHNPATSSSAPSSSTPSKRKNVLTEQSSTARGATYSVPTSSSYTLVVAVPSRCYISVVQPPNSKSYVFASTIDPGQSPKSIPVNGASSLELGAQSTSITVDVAGKPVGQIATPRIGYIYTFVPSNS